MDERRVDIIDIDFRKMINKIMGIKILFDIST